MTALLLSRLVHFLGITLWLGGLLATGLLLRAKAEARLAAILADAGATLTILSGLYNAVTVGAFSQPWLHIKLALVAALLGVHGAMRIRVRRADGRSAGAMVLTVGILAVLIVYMVVFQPLHRP
jgi:uncharacterized membrane protein